MSALAVRDLSVKLGGARVLEGVTVAFWPGRVTAVLGPNGAGKSTLLGCLAGLIEPQSGAVTLGDAPRATLSPREIARRIGYLPQSADVHWHVDVATLVALGRYPHRGRWGEAATDREAVAQAMVATKTTRFADRVVNSLSGGERARVLLARVLAGEPEWLLADEPLANLDPAHQIDGLECLRAVAARGAGVVVVLHDLNHAARVADDVVLMRDGRIIALGTSDDVLTPELIERTYRVTTHIGHSADGQRFIVATGRSRGEHR